MIGKRTVELVCIVLALACLAGVAISWVRSAQELGRNTKLHSWAMEGDTARIQAHLAAGGDVEARTSTGKTLLMSAAWQGQAAMLQLLLAHRAEVDAADREGKTPLLYAASMDRRFPGTGHLATVKVLLAAGARPERRDHQGRDALAMASAEGNASIVGLLKQAESTAP